MHKRLSGKAFIFLCGLIVISGLALTITVYYALNIQYQSPKTYSLAGNPVTVPPNSLRIDLDKPDTDSLTFDQSVIVSGKTGPVMDVLVMTNSQNLIIKSKPDGTFSVIVDLDEGVNKIIAAVFDAKGDSRFSERTVYYSKEKI